MNYCGAMNGADYWASYRFTLNSPIPAGAVITRASLDLYVRTTYQWDSASRGMRIVGDASGDASQATTMNDHPGGSGGHTATTAQIRWPTKPDAGLVFYKEASMNTAPDIASIVQELVDAHNGLATGAHIQFWIARGLSPSYDDGQLGLDDFSLGTDHKAEFSVQWSKP